MRFMRYASLLGLAKREQESSPQGKDSLSTFTTTPVITVPTHFGPTPIPIPELHHHHHHHEHNHGQLHKKHNLHPTQQAYIAQLNAKENAYKRIGDEIIEEQKRKKAKREETSFRPLIVTNHLVDETVWPGYSSKQQSGGFELKPGQSYTVELPLGKIEMLRVWIRRGCTEGPKKGELHCLTGDCNRKIICTGFGLYGSTQLENAFYPEGNPGGSFIDGSNVEGVTTLQLSVTVDGCMTLKCDASDVSCPEDMQVKDASGKILACSCGAQNWDNLQQNCPDHPPVSDIQREWKLACPDFYSYSSDDLTGQKYCPFEEKNAMRVDIGAQNKQSSILGPVIQDNNEQVLQVPQENAKAPVQITSQDPPKADSTTQQGQVTSAPSITYEDSWTESPAWISWKNAGYPM